MPLLEEQNEYLPSTNVHFTYKTSPDRMTLCQGDVLEITEELSTVLEEVHPYFAKEQYKYFLVLSQSCDLVRRDGKTCKTPYITLAAVRSYDSFLKRELLKRKWVEESQGLLLMEEKQKERAYQLVERIYNNTEPEYFFLYKDEYLGFSETMIAYLRVSIALKSSEHYEECLRAKRVELSDEFKAKLGWLVGNMYSRVGTADWDGILTAQQKTDMLNNELSTRCIVGSKEQLKQLKKELSANSEQISTHDDAVSFVAGIQIPTKYEQVMAIIEQVFGMADKRIPAEQKQQLLNAIKSRQALKTLLTK